MAVFNNSNLFLTMADAVQREIGKVGFSGKTETENYPGRNGNMARGFTTLTPHFC